MRNWLHTEQRYKYDEWLSINTSKRNHILDSQIMPTFLKYWSAAVVDCTTRDAYSGIYGCSSVSYAKTLRKLNVNNETLIFFLILASLISELLKKYNLSNFYWVFCTLNLPASYFFMIICWAMGAISWLKWHLNYTWKEWGDLTGSTIIQWKMSGRQNLFFFFWLPCIQRTACMTHRKTFQQEA